MLVKVQKWGNSQGIRLSKEVLAEANILVGDALEIITTKEQIVIKPVRKIRGIAVFGAKRTGYNGGKRGKQNGKTIFRGFTNTSS